MSKLRIAIGQMNPSVGDFRSNTQKILTWIDSASSHQADLIVFPEMALCGYPVWDLANKRDFVQKGLKSLEQIVKSTRGKELTVALGFLDQGNLRDGRSKNTVAWIRDGKIVCKQVKRLLPTYDVFLENIFFEPGQSSQVVPWKKFRVGFAICEDIWDKQYPVKPLEELYRKKANLILSVSASPFYSGVGAAREALVKGHVKKYSFPMLYVNQVGAQDDLIFDGRSFFMDSKGRVLFRAPAFKEDLFFFDWDPEEKKPALAQGEDTSAEIGEV